MTNNSKICRELYEISLSMSPVNFNSTPDDSSYEFDRMELNIFKERYPDINIKVDGNFAIFNYGITSDFSNPIIQEARGIIINLVTLEVVCWPFRKFGKYDEYYADTIDWKSAVVQEKIDGSIIKLWFDKDNLQWKWSTNSMINAADAICNKESGETFMDAIRKTKEYETMIDLVDGFAYKSIYDEAKIKIIHTNYDSDINTKLGHLTYIFELTTPDNRVVINHKYYEMTLIGARNNITGDEYDLLIDCIDRPRKYDLHHLDDCIEWCKIMNNDEYNMIGNVYHEGFVVVDKNFNRVKIKTPEYMLFHGLISGDKVSVKNLVELIYYNRLDITSICRNFPELAHIILFYSYQVEEMLYEAHAIIDIARKLNKILSGNRKEIAMRIKDMRLSMLGFKALDNPELSENDIIEGFYESGIMTKCLPRYSGENFSNCFRDLPENEC